MMNKRKKEKKEEGIMRTEESEEEEEDLPGAKAHDMNKWQQKEIKQWLDEHPNLKAEAMK
eukprot:2933292-Heterocapsa_arctica.AAC.1